MISLISEIVIGLLLYSVFWYLISLQLKRSDVADIAWGLGFCFISIYLFIAYPRNDVANLIYGLVIFWGLRLSGYIALRNRNKGEDFRYRNWRKEWGRQFLWRSYLQVFLLQAMLILVIAFPILFISSVGNVQLTVWSLLGVSIWIIGFVFQMVGDAQLAKFIKDRKNNSEIIQNGLWKHSRHPNYFGEILMWWGIFFVVLPFAGGFICIISPLTITLLIRYVSGVPMLESKYTNNKAYQKYKSEVPALFPRLFFRSRD